MSAKVKCQECNWQGVADEILLAPNPFEQSDEINGCPDCKCVDTIIYACDEPDCWMDVTCGTPTKDGYRNTCGKHSPK